jgi:hypothetical protein
MAVTKITVSTAMRARDVSRPHADHLTEAAEREAAVTRQPAQDGSSAASPGAPASASAPAPAAASSAPLAGSAEPAQSTARRRRRRGRLR